MTDKLENKNSFTNEEEPPGRLAVLISPHLLDLAKNSPAIKRQFVPSPEEDKFTDRSTNDPLKEDQYIKTKGLVHKYPNRVLIELTLTCASYCRFCTRRRMVSDLNKLKVTPGDVDRMCDYLKQHTQINEVVISGGDPLTVPEILDYALEKFQQIGSIKIIRIHTRVPVSNPKLMTSRIYQSLKRIKKTLYISIHFEHFDEITSITEQIINKLHRCGAILLSQTVFLKGVNDSVKTLKTLFCRLSELGVRPYYIYHCDPVRGAEHFIVSFEKEVKIMTELRKQVSGIAYPTYVIDTPNGSGKVPVPLDFWNFEKASFEDFENKRIQVIG